MLTWCACRCAFRVRVCCHSFSGATWSISNDYGFMVSTCGRASNSWSEFSFFSESFRNIQAFTSNYAFLPNMISFFCLSKIAQFFSMHPETIQNPSNSSFLSRSRLCDAPLAKSAKNPGGFFSFQDPGTANVWSGIFGPAPGPGWDAKAYPEKTRPGTRFDKEKHIQEAAPKCLDGWEGFLTERIFPVEMMKQHNTLKKISQFSDVIFCRNDSSQIMNN